MAVQVQELKSQSLLFFRAFQQIYVGGSIMAKGRVAIPSFFQGISTCVTVTQPKVRPSVSQSLLFFRAFQQLCGAVDRERAYSSRNPFFFSGHFNNTANGAS